MITLYKSANRKVHAFMSLFPRPLWFTKQTTEDLKTGNYRLLRIVIQN